MGDPGVGGHVTFRQILGVLQKRSGVIVAVMLIAVVVAVVYLQFRVEKFTSSGTVRLSAVVTDASYSGVIGDASIAIDPSIVLAPAVLDRATAALGEPTGSLNGTVTVDSDANARLARLTIGASGSSPEQARARADAVITAYQEYISEQVRSTVDTLRASQQDAIERARDLQAVITTSPGDTISQANLQSALQQMTSLTTAIDGVTNGGAETIVLRAPAPGSSGAPSMPIVLLLALATGLVVGIAAVLIRDQFDDRLRGEEEVEDLTGARALGELNWDRRLRRAERPLPVAENDRTDLSERLRTLRSTVQVFLPARGAAFVVTSVEPGDGKSFVSANLALAWSRAGKEVILVGGDLRRPGLGRYLGDAADGSGLSDILSEHEVGEALPRDAVESRLNATAHRRLRVLPAGAEPSDPADLLARPVMADVLTTLRSSADVIIIDSPPTIGMADAALLASHTDGVVMIASVGRTNRGLLSDAVASLRTAGVELLGVVANRGRRRLPKSYASYYVAASSSTGAGAERRREGSRAR